MRELVVLVVGLFLGDLLYFFRAGRGVERGFSRLANHKRLAIVIAAALPMVLRVALLPWIPIPEPVIADEFSFVLGAQTLAAGRLTNPVHPFWRHFESFHINVVPSYQSQYPPAPSLFMALPMWFGLHYWWGVWLATGLMAGAFCWALQPLIGYRYALLAALFVGLKYGVLTQYSDSYWGGSVCALGAAITLGAFVRLIEHQRIRHGILLVIGVWLLANSRPFEGFMFCMPLAAAIGWFALRRPRLVRMLIPATALLAFGFALTGYYNFRGTGHALEMPYIANFKQYHFVQPFFGMALLPVPHYRYDVMRTFFAQWEGRPGLLAQTFHGIKVLERAKADYYYDQHFEPTLLLAILGLWAAASSRRRLWLALTAIFVAIGLFSVVWWPLSSYAAPLLVSYFGLAFLGVRALRTLRIGNRRVGYYWGRGVAVALIIVAIAQVQDGIRRGIYANANARVMDQTWPPTASAAPVPWNVERSRVVNQLEHEGGQHLVFVDYAPWHIYHHEWVYNTPDIDRQQVVLARMLDHQDDCRLVNYYPNRKVWFVRADETPYAQLIPMDSIYAPFHCR